MPECAVDEEKDFRIQTLPNMAAIKWAKLSFGVGSEELKEPISKQGMITDVCATRMTPGRVREAECIMGDNEWLHLEQGETAVRITELYVGQWICFLGMFFLVLVTYAYLDGLSDWL